MDWKKDVMKALGCWLVVGMVLGFSDHAAWADGDQALAQGDRIAELERVVGVLADELNRTRRELAVPDDSALVAQYGKAPGASKVYGLSKGLSFGGYGEAYYRKLVANEGTGKDKTDMLRMVLYTGYKFTDRIVFNSEIEFEHASTGKNGSASVEFAHLDFMVTDWATIRAGLLLAPMGFINAIHEPPSYFGVSRPDVESRIIPSTWRENGVGVLGTLFEQLDYEAYVINGFDAKGFDANGLRGGRQKGSKALADHLAFVGRLDWTPIPELLVGGSFYYGKAGQNQTFSVAADTDKGYGAYSVNLPDAEVSIWELHAQYQSHGFHFRTLFAMSDISDNAALTAALAPKGAGGGIGELAAGEGVGGEMLGVYAEVAYDVLPLFVPDTTKSLEPFFRYEYLDTQRDMPKGVSKDKSKENQSYTAGISFKPVPNVVVKVDYRNRQAEAGKVADEFNMGIGFVF